MTALEHVTSARGREGIRPAGRRSGPPTPTGPKRAGRTEGKATARYAAGMIDWELLHWLLRCPFLRMQDLATFSGVSVATMCRRLEAAQAFGLIEQVRVAGLTRQGMERVSHLSNQGLHLLAAALDTDAATLGRIWKTDELRLQQQLPRIAHLVHLQAFIGGVLSGAQIALGEHGRRVRGTWHWVRGYAHPFTSRLRERRTLLQVDAALALHVTAQSTGLSGTATGNAGRMEYRGRAGTPGSASADSEAWERRDRWYAAFILADAPVQDWTAARRALDTLLTYRECPERWGVYQSFPPVLMLANSARHAERWLALAREVGESHHMPDLVGAVALVPGPPAASETVDPWRLPWRLLATGQTMALRSLLSPLPRAAVPRGLDQRGAQALRVDPERTITIPKHVPRVILGHFDERADALTRRSDRLFAVTQWGHPRASSSSPTAPASVAQASMADARTQQVAQRAHVALPDASAPAGDSPDSLSNAVESAERLDGPTGRPRQVELTIGAAGTGGRRETSALDAAQRTELRQLTVRLGGRLVELLALLFRAPWIEAADLADLLGMSLGSADRYLSALACHGLLLKEASSDDREAQARDRQRIHLSFAPRCRLRLSPRGQQLVAAMHRIGLRSRLAQRAAPAAPREPLAPDRAFVGTAITRGKHDHMVGIYHFFACLARAAAVETAHSAQWHAPQSDRRELGQRELPAGARPAVARLVWWETAPLCEDRYRHQGHWHNLRPDGTGVYQAGARRLRFWLEWDCGSMNGADLTRKFAAYATYVTSGRWREVTPDRALPMLLIVVQGRGQMDRMRRVATHIFGAYPTFTTRPAPPTRDTAPTPLAAGLGPPSLARSHFGAFITLAHRLEEAGPLAAIWWPLLPSKSLPTGPVTPKGGSELQPSPVAAVAPWEGPRWVFPRLLDGVPTAPADERRVISLRDQSPGTSEQRAHGLDGKVVSGPSAVRRV